MRFARIAAMQLCFLLLFCALAIPSSALAGRFNVSSPEEAARITSEIRASHFLNQATFGASIGDIRALAAKIRDRGFRRAIEEWIDDQFKLPETKQVDTFISILRDNGYPNFENEDPENVPDRLRADAWWHNAIASEDQLRQRMAWALSQIFVVNDATGFNTTRMERSGLPRCAAYSQYYDIFVERAFDNYRNVLDDVTFHPIMGFFLTHLNNRKADPSKGIYPDENYARECMQLFTIGLYKVKDLTGEYARDENGNLIPTYDNTDIDTMSRVFTGLTFNSPGFAGSANYTQPMKMYHSQHDRDQKRLLDGTVLPPRNSSLRDVKSALDMLFNQTETAPFVSRQLIQRFTHSNPSPKYIHNVARWFHGGRTGRRGDLKAVTKAILLSSEATGLRIKRIRDDKYNVVAIEVQGRRDAQTSLQEPVIRLTKFIRAFDGESLARDDRFHIGDMRTELNQSPFKSPSVFNFYKPDHQPVGPLTGTGLVAPEFEILTSVSVNEFQNLLTDAVARRRLSPRRLNSRSTDVRLDFGELFDVIRLDSHQAFRSEGIDAALAYLDILLCHGTLSEETKQTIKSAILRTLPTSTGSRRRQALIAMVSLVLTSPDCAIVD